MCAETGTPVLSHQEVEFLLFHELGHALHNVLSQSEFQHLSGARGELEFAEVCIRRTRARSMAPTNVVSDACSFATASDAFHSDGVLGDRSPSAQVRSVCWQL